MHEEAKLDATTCSEFDSILRPSRVFSRPEALARPSPVPKEAGVYAWYFREIPPRVPIDGCNVHNGLTLLYVGISPSRTPANGASPSRQQLRKRIRTHFRGNASGSTLRLTLGTLLSERLGISLVQHLTSGRYSFGADEAVLSAWMDANAFVCWHCTTEPWVLERAFIAANTVPLNLQGNGHHSFRETLSGMRTLARAGARAANDLQPRKMSR